MTLVSLCHLNSYLLISVEVLSTLLDLYSIDRVARLAKLTGDVLWQY